MDNNVNIIEKIVNAVISEINAQKHSTASPADTGSGAGVLGIRKDAPVDITKDMPVSRVTGAPVREENNAASDGTVDITSKEVKSIPLIENPADEDGLRRMMSKTSARIGVGRAGPRLKTQTMLALRADHASARDAVFLDVDEKLLESLNLFSVKTKCNDKNEFLTRPDLGREFDPETEQEIKSKCIANPDVQIYLSDGLSSRAIEANAANILPSLMEGIKNQGFSVGTPFFVKFGRVAAMDHISELLGAKVTCVLIGERPGLGSGESMSAYIAYKATVGMPEANRTVVSNIYSGGISAVEAGAYISEVIAKIMQNKASGVNLKK